MGAFAAISAAFFYLPFLWAFGESAVTVFVSCHVPGDVAPWLRGTRFCAESRDECLLVPACLLEFLFEGCFMAFFTCFADWILDAFWAFFLCFADWSCAQAHLGPTYFTDTIHFSRVCRTRSSLHLNQADRIKLKMSFANKKSDCFMTSRNTVRYSSRVISD